MDFKKLAEMARVQSSLEDDETSALSESHTDSELSDPQQYDMYIPIDNDNEDPNQIPDDGYISSTGDNDNSEDIESESIIEKCFPDEKAYNIDLDRLLPFRFPIFNEEGDISDLKSSIARIGITEPLLVRSAGNGEYEILNGIRRKRAAEELLWVKVPCRIADNDLLSDENEKLIVVESNRSRLSALRLSEKVRVLSILGKDSASELEIAIEQVNTYIQLNQLEQVFLEMIDEGKISLEAAEALSSLSEKQQKQTLAVLEQHSECKITAANAKELAQSKRLTADSIAKILKPKPPVNVAISAEIISEYMENKSPEEISELVTKAICKYFEEETNGKN